jgi:pre-mRNA-splicing factor ATP-dependent RNA helicase DHX38/PRP16
VDYKDGSAFAKHMTKNEAQSEFARNKSLQQQREYLPIYGVRAKLMQVVRENQVRLVCRIKRAVFLSVFSS